MVRTQALFDRFTDEQIYNRSISPVLYPFLPWFGNLNPYGDATPNRSGVALGLQSDTSLKILNATLQMDMFGEIIGEGVEEKRKYNALTAGMAFNLHKLITLDRAIILNASIRNEKTSRNGLAAIDFKSSLLDAGLTAEAFKKFDILMGAKILSAKGNEYLTGRDEFNNVQTFTPVSVNITTNIYSAGVRFRYAEKSYFSVLYNTTDVKDNNSNQFDYTIKQLFFNYTLIF
ncbi:MAG: hypothetical protein NZ529_10300 [Cytophagaceae bacterium]|nr:hypothetical protein [Cytophagaceae bacterium]MDW8457176.1 hypothetical protein [Cytophagaceae bacterium]